MNNMSPMNISDKFILLNSTVTQHPMGGWDIVWSDGVEFDCTLQNHSSVEALQAALMGVTSLFEGIVDYSFPIRHGDVFKRVSDSVTFRVTSDPDDTKTPPISTFGQFKSFTAAKFTLPA